ncbi:MAG TPA: hypothetical protein VH599_11830 [Ktedonobacterales bacterium]|jgi:hypothetical protein
MQTLSWARWVAFVDWLSSGGVSGVLPETLRRTVGPVWLWLPLARRAAEAIGPWLLALLAERQRTGRNVLTPEAEWEGAGLLAADAEMRPLSRREAGRALAWVGWLVEAELARVVRLVEAPERRLRRVGWLAEEVRAWALVVSLARLGQVYAVLERRQGREAAECAWAGGAERVWRQTTEEPPAA